MGHIHGNSEYDFTASAMIVHQDKVLLLFHTKLQLWLPPAGHLELDESPVEAVYREVAEESGITNDHLTLVAPFIDNLQLARDENVRTEPLPFDIEMHHVGNTGHRHIDLCYIFSSDTGTIVREEDKAERLEWFAIDEVEKLSPMPKTIYSRAKYALDKVGELQK